LQSRLRKENISKEELLSFKTSNNIHGNISIEFVRLENLPKLVKNWVSTLQTVIKVLAYKPCCTLERLNIRIMHSALLFYCIFFLFVPSKCTIAIKPPIHFGSFHELLKLTKNYSTLGKEFLEKFKEPSLKYPVIENLHEYLQAFQHCFIYIQNYQGIDILPTKVPIVLSEIETVFWRNKLFHYESIHAVQKRSKKMYSKNDEIKTVVDFNCTSDFFVKESEMPEFIGYCLGLNRTKFIVNARPWNCEVHLDIFAPPYLTEDGLDGRRYGLVRPPHIIINNFRIRLHNIPYDLWAYKIYTANTANNTRRFTHSAMSLIKVKIIMIQDQGSSSNKNEHIYKWFYDSVSESLRLYYIPQRMVPDMSYEIYIAMFTTETASKTKCNITKVVALKPCYTCEDGQVNTEVETEIGHLVWKSNQLSKWQVAGNYFPLRGEMVAFSIKDGQGGLGGYAPRPGNYKPDFGQCQTFQSVQEIVKSEYADKKFELAMIHAVHLILGNHSYSNPNAPRCNKEDKIKNSRMTANIQKIMFRFDSENRIGYESFPLIKLSDDNSVFTFVSCGKPPSKGFAFEELLNVFGMEIWIFVLVSIVLITLAIIAIFNAATGRLWKIEKIISALLQVVKPLLEQGDPFTSTVADNKMLRFCTGTFLLVGIVLSNAYKSSNVYNLVTPLKPIPYENLSQLFSDSFNIYSRATYADQNVHLFRLYDHFRLYSYKNFMNVTTIDQHPFKYTDRGEYRKVIQGYASEDTFFFFGPAVFALDMMMYFESEISMLFLKNYEKVSPLYWHSFSERNHNFTNAPNGSQQLLEAIKLVPGLNGVMSDLMLKLCPNEEAHRNFQRLWRPTFHEEAKVYLKKSQQEIYTELLQDCNNAAVYLPRETANKVASKIQRPFNQLVYIGKENLLKSDYYIDLFGHIPPFVLSSIASLQESGIMMRIFDFILATAAPPPTERTMPFKPTMEGNILVIFMVLFGGFGISAFCFFGEMHKVLWKFTCNMMAKVWSAMHRAYYHLYVLRHRTKTVPMTFGNN